MESYWPMHTITFQRCYFQLAKALNTLSFSSTPFYPFCVDGGQIICNSAESNIWKLPGPDSLKRAEMALEPRVCGMK